MKTIASVCVAFLFLSVAFSADDAAWPIPVKDFVAPQPGEHPRLLFRKTDIPMLRARAETPDGKKIVARLRDLLGNNGDATPSQFNTGESANSIPDAERARLPMGSFTVTHASGYGFLFVLTGDKKYAALAQESVEKVFAGQLDRDRRYCFTRPGTGFRLGLVLQGIALAYDFCYDAWEPAFREKVVKTILEMKPTSLEGNGKSELTLEFQAEGGKYPPGSNHFGAFLPGVGLMCLAMRGDPGVDDRRIDAVIQKVEQSVVAVLTKGYGDHGWFAEGTSTGRIAGNTGVVPLLQSLKIAGGKDYISSRTNGRFVALRLPMELIPIGGKPQVPHRGPYGSDFIYDRVPMISHSGDFCQAMGSVLPDEAAALRWIYEHFIESGEEKSFDGVMYPHHSVYAFVNWAPQSKNPGDVLLRAFEDKIAGYYFFRNRWQDGDDILVTALNGTGPHGYHKIGARPVMVYGLSEKLTFGELNGPTTYFSASPDGSGIVTCGGTSLGIDYSKSSGADALIVMTGPGAKGNLGSSVNKTKSKVYKIDAGGKTFQILSLSAEGKHPEPKADGDKIVVGGQTISFDGKQIMFSKMQGSTPVK